MSTYIQAPSGGEQFISEDSIRNYFQAFAKQPGGELVGLEWELFGVNSSTGKSLPYYGKGGIQEVLIFLAAEHGFEKIEENGCVIALRKGKNTVGLEPGGQVELAAEPFPDLHGVSRQWACFKRQITQASQVLNLSWLGIGFQPFSGRDEIEWVPKKRYAVMRDYLADKGELAHDMMKRTTAIQISLDFLNEQDAVEKMRTVFALTTLISAVFANSPLYEGKENGLLSQRMRVWQHTDAERSGILPAFLSEGATLADYLEYALQAPMFFIVREQNWIPLRGLRFKEYLNQGFAGHRATLADFELHLSTLFPEVRIKNWIEIRGADGQDQEWVLSVAALWKGLLYDRDALGAAWELMRKFTAQERLVFQQEAQSKGPRAYLGKQQGWDLAREIFALALEGLKRQKKVNEAGEDETVYLRPFMEEFVKARKTPAEKLLEKWRQDWRRDPALLVQGIKI